MERIIEEISTPQDHQQGRRVLLMTRTDTVDRIKTRIEITREDEVSVPDTAPEYAATGEISNDGVIVDELLVLIGLLNRYRFSTRMPQPVKIKQ